jgi:tetratricopeptide (TPR) repeat protein
MEDKNKQKRIDTLKSAISPRADLFTSAWQSAREPTTELLSAWRAELDRSLAAYRFGDYRKSEEMLTTLRNKWDRIILKQSSQGTGASQVQLLDAAALTLLGRIRARQQRRQEAESLFAQAVSLYDQWIDRDLATGFDYRNYGIALYRNGQSEEAVKYLNRAIEEGDESPDTYRYLGEHSYKSENYEEAERLLGKALEISPDDQTVCRLLAWTLEARGKYEEAASIFRKYAHSLMLFDEFDEALEALNHSLQVKQDDFKTLSLKADILLEKSQYEDALEILKSLLGKDPDDAWAVLGAIGATLYEMGRYEEALEELDRALASASEDERPMAARSSALVKGAALQALGRHKEALDEFDKALEASTDDVFILGSKSLSLNALGNREEALYLLDKALSMSPDDLFTLTLKEQVLTDLGRDEEALDILLHITEAHPSLGWPLIKLSDALIDFERYDEALEAIDKALEVSPDDAYALGTRGQILYAQDKTQEAVELLKRAAELDPQLPWVRV